MPSQDTSFLTCTHGLQVDEVIQLYQDHHRWEDAIRVADAAHHDNAAALKQQYLAWLMETGQEEQAGAVKEREGDYMAAIGLYLKGGLPGRAAQVRSHSTWTVIKGP